MSVNVKLGDNIINNVDNVKLKDATSDTTYHTFSLGGGGSNGVSYPFLYRLYLGAYNTSGGRVGGGNNPVTLTGSVSSSVLQSENYNKLFYKADGTPVGVNDVYISFGTSGSNKALLNGGTISTTGIGIQIFFLTSTNEILYMRYIEDDLMASSEEVISLSLTVGTGNITDAKIYCLCPCVYGMTSSDFKTTDIYFSFEQTLKANVSYPFTMNYYLHYRRMPICMLTGTKITLADGSKKNIEDLTYSDTLRVWNFDDARYDSSSICFLTKIGLKNTHYYKLTFSDGTILKTTGKNSNHRVYSYDKQKFVGVRDVEIGEKVFSENGILTITNKEYFDEDVYYYNVITSQHFNCFANGILTSDRYGNMYDIDANMKFIKDGRIIRPYSDYEQVGISQYWYDNLRLGEQRETIDKTIEYIRRLQSQMRDRT